MINMDAQIVDVIDGYEIVHIVVIKLVEHVSRVVFTI